MKYPKNEHESLVTDRLPDDRLETIGNQLIAKAQKISSEIGFALRFIRERKVVLYDDRGPYRSFPPVEVTRTTWFGKCINGGKRLASTAPAAGVVMGLSFNAVGDTSYYVSRSAEITEEFTAPQKADEVESNGGNGSDSACLPPSQRPCIKSYWTTGLVNNGRPSFRNGVTNCTEDFVWGPCE